MARKKYIHFNETLLENLCWSNEIVCNYEKEFDSIKEKMIEIAKDNRIHSKGFSIVRKYGNKKLTIYFDFKFIIKNNKEFLDVKVTAIYFRGKRLYEDCIIMEEWEI